MTPRRTTRFSGLWWAFVWALAVASCANGGGAAPDRDQVRVRVAKVGLDQETGLNYVLLRENGGNRSLPMLIGADEARAILFELHGVKPERPLTYELLREVIVRTGNRVDRVVIAELRGQTYFARIFLDRGRYSIDSRPSDAIALALGANAPIFVSGSLLEVSTGPVAAKPIRTVHRLGLSVQEITPELAQYFEVTPLAGVLVAEAGPEAITAGIEHGDIITQIEGHDVHTPEEFTRESDAAAAVGNVAVTVLRQGRTQVVTLPRTGKAAQR